MYGARVECEGNWGGIGGLVGLGGVGELLTMKSRCGEREAGGTCGSLLGLRGVCPWCRGCEEGCCGSSTRWGAEWGWH